MSKLNTVLLSSDFYLVLVIILYFIMFFLMMIMIKDKSKYKIIDRPSSSFNLLFLLNNRIGVKYYVWISTMFLALLFMILLYSSGYIGPLYDFLFDPQPGYGSTMITSIVSGGVTISLPVFFLYFGARIAKSISKEVETKEPIRKIRIHSLAYLILVPFWILLIFFPRFNMKIVRLFGYGNAILFWIDYVLTCLLMFYILRLTLRKNIENT